MFEAMIMNREISNPCYRFLFENQGPAHVYYRWKLFSILQGDSTSRWNMKPFRMFEGGSIWKPPPVDPFLQGMPEELVKQDQEEEEKNKRGSLSNAQRGRLEHMIRHLTPEREKVGEAMVWCIEHAEAAEEICQCLCEALTNNATPVTKKVPFCRKNIWRQQFLSLGIASNQNFVQFLAGEMARLYLVSDILHNCSVKVTNASFYRKGLQCKLQEIFEGLHNAHNIIESRLKAEQLKQRVLQCCRAWEDWAVYPPEFLISLQNIFLGLVKRSANNGIEPEVKPSESVERIAPRIVDDVDGIPLDDVDGVPLSDMDGSVFKDDLDGSPYKPNNTPLLKSSAAISALQGYDDDDEDDDIDGAPLDDDVDGVPLGPSRLVTTGTGPGFVPPKWESVSPKRVEAQAMTLSKWDTLEAQLETGRDSGSDSTPVYDQPGASPRTLESNDHRKSAVGRFQIVHPYNLDGEASEERRARLREVEVRVLQYQDELERGARPLKPGYTLAKQVQHYRHKLLRKVLSLSLTSFLRIFSFMGKKALLCSSCPSVRP
ncbi:hypothetical protein HAZT_HAZT006479 [Hyalella azteca]|uniref:CID domain-containing protein n=1 Tax=Hyalella azteca TaxID=294128 RepID=A0A6A0HBA6_HYAAZ|nr:hypothetical protein HAZT_HAZT006479 [Hyalella azteca]